MKNKKKKISRLKINNRKLKEKKKEEKTTTATTRKTRKYLIKI